MGRELSNMRTKIIKITIGYESEEEIKKILAGIKEALPKSAIMSVEQWLDRQSWGYDPEDA